MRVFLNAILLDETPSGANRRMLELLKRLPDHLPEAELYVGLQQRRAALFEFPGINAVPLRCSGDYRFRGTLARAVALKREIAGHCRRLGIDICHLFSLPPFRVKGVRMLLTIHDNRFLLFPRQYGWLRYLANLLMRRRVAGMDGVVTVSRTMRDEIERLYRWHHTGSDLTRYQNDLGGHLRTRVAQLADLVQNGLVARPGLETIDRGVKSATFRVLRTARMPAVLVELGFITNPAEEARLRDSVVRQTVADTIAAAIGQYRGMYPDGFRLLPRSGRSAAAR